MRQLLISIGLSLLIFTCSGSNQNSNKRTAALPNRGNLVYSHDLAKSITRFIPSVVEVLCMMEYDVEHYYYQFSAGQYIADASSPTGYQLKIENGILYDEKNFRAFGGGLIIGWNEKEYLILTSRHIVTQKDTIVHFIKEEGKDTPVARTRAFLKKLRFAVRGYRHSGLKKARVRADDSRADLALISAYKRGNIGDPFSGGVINKMENVWGALAVIAGYPAEILQVAMGLTSAAPYPGNFDSHTSHDQNHFLRTITSVAFEAGQIPRFRFPE